MHALAAGSGSRAGPRSGRRAARRRRARARARAEVVRGAAGGDRGSARARAAAPRRAARPPSAPRNAREARPPEPATPRSGSAPPRPAEPARRASEQARSRRIPASVEEVRRRRWRRRSTSVSGDREAELLGEHRRDGAQVALLRQRAARQRAAPGATPGVGGAVMRQATRRPRPRRARSEPRAEAGRSHGTLPAAPSVRAEAPPPGRSSPARAFPRSNCVREALELLAPSRWPRRSRRPQPARRAERQAGDADHLYSW